MSIFYIPPSKVKHTPSPVQIQKMLDENTLIMRAITDYQNRGKARECHQYLQLLHRNLVFLASVADAVPGSLPPPPPQLRISSKVDQSILSNPSSSQNQPGDFYSAQNQPVDPLSFHIQPVVPSSFQNQLTV
ncbi:Protein SSXT, partial [Stegodyphus mimosarum]